MVREYARYPLKLYVSTVLFLKLRLVRLLEEKWWGQYMCCERFSVPDTHLGLSPTLPIYCSMPPPLKLLQQTALDELPAPLELLDTLPQSDAQGSGIL